MKTMKKSMFITTILMVVLLVVALSTATFAWYTANTAVYADVTQVISAGSSTASLVVDEGIAANNMATNSSVTLTMTGDIVPMIYDSNAAPSGSVEYTDFIGDFVTFTLTNQNKYTAAQTGAAPSVISTVKGSSNSPVSQNYFYLTNTGGVAANMTATVTIYQSVPVVKAAEDSATGLYTDAALTTPAPASEGKLTAAGTYYTASNANDFLRVAIFANDYYVDTWAISEAKKAVEYYNYTGTPAVAQATLYEHSSYNARVSGYTATVATNRAPMSAGAVKIQVVAWFDGGSLTNAQAGTGACFKIDFGSSNYVAPENP